MMIRRLQVDDAEMFVALRKRALLDAPLSFAASPGDDFAASAAAVRESMQRGPEWVILGAFDDALVGSVGLFRDRHLKASHKAHIWGMYVAPGHRGRGIARGLLEAALDHARTLPGVSWVHLGVSDTALEARRLYERAGFQVWGTEPDALRHEGRSVTEYYMALRLE